MPAERTIIEASDADAVRVSTVIRQAFEPVAARFGLTPGNCPTHPSNCRPEWIVDHLGRGGGYLMLLEDDVLRGCVAMERADEKTIWLMRLAVLPAHQHAGLGRTLVEHVVATARVEGAAEVRIAIIAEHVELRTWYESLGFRSTGTKRFEGLPFVVEFMTRPLR